MVLCVESAIEELNKFIPKELIDYTRSVMDKYDESHNFAHVLRVVALSIHIYHGEKHNIPENVQNECYLIVLYASLLHDVVDHKYNTSTETVNVLANVFSTLPGPMGKIIEDIITGVSYSKEVKQGLQHLEEYQSNLPFFLLRNIVSDADKIDAIGMIGIRRCGLFSLHNTLQSLNIDPNTSEGEKAILKEICTHSHEKLLKLASQFIRTNTGKEFAKDLHCETQKYVEDAEAYLNNSSGVAPDAIWHPTKYTMPVSAVIGLTKSYSA